MRFALCLAAAILLCAGSARALTIEMPMSGQGTRLGEVSALATTGLFFGADCGGPVAECGSANLFPDLVLSAAHVGTTLFADASTGAEFAGAAASLSDGLDGFVALGFLSEGPFTTYLVYPEPSVAGLEVTRIGLRQDGFEASFDGSYSDYRYDATLFVEVVPEAPAAWLVAAALAAVALRPRAARTA